MARTKKEIASKNDVKVVASLKPRMTEKASIATDASVYTFDVALTMTKGEFKKAFVAQYKEIPRKINSVKTPAQRVFKSGKRGMQSATKKMVVYLAKGKTIAFA